MRAGEGKSSLRGAHLAFCTKSDIFFTTIDTIIQGASYLARDLLNWRHVCSGRRAPEFKRKGRD